MKIRNVSDDDREVVPADGSPPFSVAAGDTAEVSDELGANMVEQVDVWRQVGGKKGSSLDDPGEDTNTEKES